MKKFLEFLVSFTNQNYEFRESPQYLVHHLDKIMVHNNDKPLVNIDVRIKRFAKVSQNSSND